jgi:hypothetical protein
MIRASARGVSAVYNKVDITVDALFVIGSRVIATRSHRNWVHSIRPPPARRKKAH